MHLLSDYIQPLTVWFYDHPNFALIITFFISFIESLAVIGSFVPGSVAMTAIGLLAGSGVMRIDLTFLAAILGAVAGDGTSYALGYIYSNKLSKIWPFKNYPTWLEYGQIYFAKHGPMSIIIGRFIGPMRSIIPVIAGMMHMKRWHFIIANVISALIWASVYVFPGILIGAASSELSAESTTRLFASILIFLVVTWIATMCIKWLFSRMNHLLQRYLHQFWLWINQQRYIVWITKNITPQHETNHFPTAALTITLFVCLLLSSVLIILAIEGIWIMVINNPIYYFFQSLRTHIFDLFFISVSLIISPLPLLTLASTLSAYAIYFQDWRLLKYWLTLCFSSATIILLFSLAVYVPEPSNLLRQYTPFSFPAKNLTFATSLCSFLICYLNMHYRSAYIKAVRIILMIVLMLAGIAPMYLGDNWFTSILAAYVIGLSISLLHWIYYRRTGQSHHRRSLPILLCCLLITIMSYISYHLYIHKIVRIHLPKHRQYVLTHDVWWNQQRPLLPIYSTNRFGKRTGLLNIQYLGSIKNLQHSLEAEGWQHQPNSFFYSLLIRVGGHNSTEDLPLMAQLYLNQKPTLMMTYNIKEQKTLVVLRLWRSNFHLRHYTQPIWLGSVLYSSKAMKKGLQPYPVEPATDYLLHALSKFKINKIQLPLRYLQPLPYPTSSNLLILQEPIND